MPIVGSIEPGSVPITTTPSPTAGSQSTVLSSNSVTATYLDINPSAIYLGPLTTVFTPPSTCLNVFTQWESSSPLVIFHGIWGDPDCYPGDVRVLGQNYGAYYYSPAVCPSGFTEACQDRRQWNPRLVQITASICCPIGFGCKEDLSGEIEAPECTSTATTAISSVWAGDTANPTGVPSDAVFYALPPPQRIWMNAIPIAWQNKDEGMRARATRISLGNSSNAPGSGSSPRSSMATSSSGTNNNTEKAGIHAGSPGDKVPKGAKIAVVICVHLVIIACIVAAVMYRRRRKRRSKEPTADHHNADPAAELPGESIHEVMHPPTEMDAAGEQMRYIPYDGPPIELPTSEKDRRPEM